MVGPGKCRVIKALSHYKPHLPSTKKILARIVSLAGTEIQPVVGIEFTPYKNAPSILNDAYAFQRPQFAHGFVVTTWKTNTPENLALARSVAREIADIVATGQLEQLGQVERGYGNYGT